MRKLMLLCIVFVSVMVPIGCNQKRVVKPPEGAPDTATDPSAVGASLSKENPTETTTPANK